MQPPAWIADYNSLRDGAGYAQLPNWSIVEFQGRDRATFLNNFCTNAVRDLATGQIREVFITDVKGHTIGHGHVVALEESLLFITVPEQAYSLIKHFDRYIIREQVTLSDLTKEKSIYSLTGAKSTESLASITNELTTTHGANFFDINSPQPESKLAIAASDKSAAIESRLLAAGIVQCFYDAWNAIRIENGYPLFTTDITADNLPQEIQRDKQAISFTKGCYLGQETVARIDALGQVNKLLVGIRIDEAIENTSTKEFIADGKSVGRLTSMSYSPRLNATLALGYVKRQFAAVGTKLSLGNVACEVVKLPIE